MFIDFMSELPMFFLYVIAIIVIVGVLFSVVSGIIIIVYSLINRMRYDRIEYFEVVAKVTKMNYAPPSRYNSSEWNVTVRYDDSEGQVYTETFNNKRLWERVEEIGEQINVLLKRAYLKNGSFEESLVLSEE